MIAHLALALSLTTAPPDKWFGSDKLKHFFMAAFTQTVAYSALQAARVRHDQAVAGRVGRDRNGIDREGGTRSPFVRPVQCPRSRVGCGGCRACHTCSSHGR